MTPYTTKTGVKMGSMYQPPMQQLDHDAEQLQRVLIQDEKYINIDAVVVAVVVVAVVVVAVVVVCALLGWWLS
jgi:hypothetical protein